MDASPFEIGLVGEGSNGKPKKSYILDYCSFVFGIGLLPRVRGTYEWVATIVKAQYAIRFIECNNVL